MCEGDDEDRYLRGARCEFRLPRSGVVIKPHRGGSPEGIVAAAVAERERHDGNGEASFDSVWAVLDAERAAISGVPAALSTAAAAGVRVALSNPCFEVWLLLHAGPQAAPLTAQEAKRLCAKHLGIPRRNGRRATFADERLGATWETAARYAKLGRQQARKDAGRSMPSERLVLERNPSSNLDELLSVMRQGRAGSTLR